MKATPKKDAAKHVQARAAKALDTLTQKRREETYATGRKNNEFYKGPHMELDAVMKGVTIGWLAQAFGINHTQAKNKLRDCPPLYRRKEGFIYDLRVAVPYLIKPVFNIEDYLKNASVEDLPLRLQTEFWAAMNKRREYEEATGHLWRSEDVFEVLGEVFQLMKNTMQLWSSDVERQTGLTDVQRGIIRDGVDRLQDQIYEKLVSMVKNPRTKSLRQIEAEAEAKRAAAEPAPVEEDEDDYSHLI